MSIAVGVVLGAALGFAMGFLVARRMHSRPAKPSALSWTAFVFGLAAVVTLASALFLPLALPGPAGSAFNSAQLSIVLSMAGVTDAVWALARRDRHWVSWTALVVAALPTLFWALFALGYLLEPAA